MLALLVIGLYIVSAILFYRASQKKLPLFAPLLGLAASTQTHITLLVAAIMRSPNTVNMSVFNVMSLTAWVVACLSFFWLWRREMALSGFLLCLINAFLVLIEILFPSQKLMHYSSGMLSHIAMAIAAWTVLTVALIHACLYSFFYTRLKRKKLPQTSVVSLSHLERLTANYLLLGTIFLVFSILLGCIFMPKENSQILWLKMPFTILAAAFYIFAFVRYVQGKKRGIALIYFSFYAYILLLIGYVFSNILAQFFVAAA